METATLVTIFISGFTCKLYWIRFIYRLWPTFSTTKRSIRRTRGLIEVMSPHQYWVGAHYFN
ncbi:hypothetical protein DsansV1_C62g0268061 [Dioscorea sansibarensis]